MIKPFCENLKHRCTGCESVQEFAYPYSCIGVMVLIEEGFAFPSIGDSRLRVMRDVHQGLSKTTRAPQCESLAGAWSF